MTDLDFPRLFGRPESGGLIRRVPEDFQVDEVLGFEPEGEGEHLFLQIQKRGDNTLWVARQLARAVGLPPAAVSYSGLKDRQALTTQWFGMHLPGVADPDLSALEASGLRILQRQRHRKKLRSGVHRGNRFRIRLRELDNLPSVESRLEAVQRSGVPNYFGEQRFGLQGANLTHADALFRGELRVRDRKQRGFYLSAARAYLFNQIVARRVEAATLGHYLEGDCLMLAGRTSLFRPAVDEPVQERLDRLEVHPTGPMWGGGRLMSSGACAEMETDILAPYQAWCQGLEAAGLKQERRALRLRVEELTWTRLADDELEVAFYLPTGAFATSVLRELCEYRVYRDAGEPPSHEDGE